MLHERARRPVNTPWSRWAIEPLAIPLVAWALRHPAVRSSHFTALALFGTLGAAAAFNQDAQPGWWWCLGILLVQLATLMDTADGWLARSQPGRGSVTALVADHILDPLRLVFCASALFLAAEADAAAWTGLCLFMTVHLADWSVARTTSKVRATFASGMYRPQWQMLDERLLRTSTVLATKAKLKLNMLGPHERELMVLGLAPATGWLPEVTWFAAGLSLAALVLRQRFDIMLLKHQMLTDAQVYLSDAAQPWETPH